MCVAVEIELTFSRRFFVENSGPISYKAPFLALLVTICWGIYVRIHTNRNLVMVRANTGGGLKIPFTFLSPGNEAW